VEEEESGKGGEARTLFEAQRNAPRRFRHDLETAPLPNICFSSQDALFTNFGPSGGNRSPFIHPDLFRPIRC
jgi:hypothetical protein